MYPNRSGDFSPVAFVDRLKSLWNRRAIERAQQIAFTNFVLAELRVPLKVEYEAIPSLLYDGRINGAAFKAKSESWIIRFHSVNVTLSNFHFKFRMFPIHLDILGFPAESKQVTDALELAETKYETFLQTADPAYLHQVRRIVFDVWFTSEKHKQNLIVEEIVLQLTAVLGGSSWIDREILYFDSMGQWLGGGEIVFPEPVPEVVIIKRFQRIAPKFTGPLAGQVVDISNYSRKEIDLPGVCTMKMLARQF